MRWYRCNPSAKPLPYTTAFGNSWFRNNQLFVPKNGMTDDFEPVDMGNRGGFLGTRPCGDSDAWLNGVSISDPPAPCNCEREALIPVQEVPVGIIDGVNRVFITSHVPISDWSLLVFINGVQQKQGTNYSIVADTIYFTPSSVPRVNANVTCYYFYAE